MKNIKVQWTNRPAKLIQRGHECSEIEWLDTKSRQALPNDQLEFDTKRPDHMLS